LILLLQFNFFKSKITTFYFLCFKNCTSESNFGKIESFIDEIFKNKNISTKAREFAEKVLDYKEKEKKIRVF